MIHISTVTKRVSFFIIAFVLSTIPTFAQIDMPVKWSVSSTVIDNDTYELSFKAKIDKGFSIYSYDIKDDGPIPTSIHFEPSDDYKLLGGITHLGKKETFFDPIFEMELSKFKNEVTFKQKVKLLKDKATVIGYYEAQACNEIMCYPPDGDDFKFSLTRKNDKSENVESETKSEEKSGIGESENIKKIESEPESDVQSKNAEFNWENTNVSCVKEDRTNDGGIWVVFILGFLGGLIALLTPCVFPMIPLTVSFFTKGGKDKKQGVKQAMIYGISIILIYIALGLSVTLIFGADALNVMSTSAFFNILFFIIFILFALSLFGLFEITLPSSWANKTDQMSDKGGFIGIFFMAFTLALVSFSCTAPIIGSLLVQTATDVAGPAIGFIKLKPVIGMLGFSLALALPFTLFALFPQWMKGLPKSGGWLGKVKVILGLLELAFAFKFLSVVDLTQGWGILRWELFMGIWIILFMIIGFYALGLFSKDKTPNLIRLFGLASILFASYMIYSTVNYQPIRLLSGLAPTTHYNFFNSQVKELSNSKDFEEAVQMAQAENKPILIDFTGYGCVNCREMEEQVWVDDDIKSMMGEYVIASLYVDDRTPLPEEEQYHSSASGRNKKIRTIGNKWTDFEIKHFQKASQPFYVLVDADMNVLTTPVGYSDIETFKNFLNCGLTQYKNKWASLK
ncbi:MAG: thioredoxin family protein [Chitinophagales bacterium]|nr:thioredoxin family protein [Chitinophagales bacterium]